MPHTYTFDPPVRCKGGPALTIRFKDPLLEKTLASKMVQGHETPYRKSRDVENLLDDISFGVKPARLNDGILMVSLGLSQGLGTKFEFSRSHTHSTTEPMYPDVLLAHSTAEDSGRIVKVSVMDELNILAVALLRELGQPSYLSAIHAADGSCISGLVVISGESIQSFIISGSHPSVSKLTIYEDNEVVDVLRLLRAHNGLRLLFYEIKDSSRISSFDQERFNRLMSEFAVGAESAHHLVNVVEGVFLAFVKRFPELIGTKERLS
jgi:hypothetical protein